jgi:predicted branched-subunit amino acid permease
MHEARAGLREVLPILLVIAPFAMVFGTIAFQSELTIWQTLGFGGFIYAGASQLAALQMIGQGAPVWAALLSIFALNFRHVLYSASIGRHLTRFSPIEKALSFFLLVDPSFAAAESRAEKKPLTKSFYFAYSVPVYVVWVVFSGVGYASGNLIDDPHAAGLDFILPVYFLVFVLDFRKRPNFLPVAGISALTAGVLYATLGPPWHVTVGGLAGIAYAAAAKPKARTGE